ncbi:MAG: putative NADH:ubiquinone oxidoreductase chain I-like protein [Promethearchaeota archaeon]|nr:MAG: putative NADH:ubiquinone oxidoreductase chain I-like protein [Candidatus Lokiarchaeota archaeon]
MTIINVTVPFHLIKKIDDYSKIINEILKHRISFNILKFSTTSEGINLLIDIPQEKTSEITESLMSNEIQVNKKGRIILDKDLCIDCGACLSLCVVDALHYKDDETIDFAEDKCIGCLICIDSCPRGAIKESK